MSCIYIYIEDINQSKTLICHTMGLSVEYKVKDLVQIIQKQILFDFNKMNLLYGSKNLQ